MRNRISKSKKAILIATAMSICMLLQPVLAKGNWLSQCLGEGGSDLSDAECYVEYTNRLKREQTGVINRIRNTLSRKGPTETDYPKALALLNQSQKQWLSFVATDCAIVTEVFGGGVCRRKLRDRPLQSSQRTVETAASRLPVELTNIFLATKDDRHGIEP
jgi:hypothetical protein